MLRALAAAIRANVPVLVWGQPGVGKTAYLETFGTRNSFQVETVVGSIREASDFLGLPIEVDGQVRYAPPSWAERLAKASKGLLFLDELTTAAPSVQRAMLRILQEREVGEMTLPPSVALVAAANPPAVAVDGWDLAAPVANRLMHLDWHFDADAWLDGVVTDFAYIDPPSLEAMLGVRTDVDAIRVKGAVTAFLKARPDLQLALPSDPALAGKGWPSPRSWTNAMAVLAELDPRDEDGALLVLKGCVGEAAAVEYLAWLAANDLYDPEAVLADPKIVDWTARPDRDLRPYGVGSRPGPGAGRQGHLGEGDACPGRLRRGRTARPRLSGRSQPAERGPRGSEVPAGGGGGLRRSDAPERPLGYHERRVRVSTLTAFSPS